MNLEFLISSTHPLLNYFLAAKHVSTLHCGPFARRLLGQGLQSLSRMATAGSSEDLPAAVRCQTDAHAQGSILPKPGAHRKITTVRAASGSG